VEIRKRKGSRKQVRGAKEEWVARLEKRWCHEMPLGTGSGKKGDGL